jgi:hypothetical protein
VPHAHRSSVRWKSGWPSSTSGSNRWTRALGTNQAGDDVRAGWLESCRSRRAPSGRGKRPAPKPAGHPRPTSNVAVAGDAVAEVAELAQAPIDRPPAGSRSRSRVRHDLSAARPEVNVGTRNADPLGATPHPDPRNQEGMEIGREAAPHRDPHHHGGRVISPISGAGAGGVEGEGAGRDRTVLRPVVARRIAGRRQADAPEIREFAGIEWTSGALA